MDEDYEIRPAKRVRLVADDVDSAYASFASPRDDDRMVTDVQSATSVTPKRPKTFFCTYAECDKAFDRPARLAIHIRSHTQDRPFVCEEEGCDKSFLRSEHLKAHVKSKHSDLRNYLCTYHIDVSDDGSPVVCGKSFHTGTRLRRHLAAHEDKEQTKCQECGQVFRKQETLQRHIRAEHLGENAFRCHREDCGQTFATAGQLKAHQSREHAAARYFCSVCQDGELAFAGFSTYSELQEHLKIVHPPVCGLCGISCASSRALKAHMDIAHSALSERQQFECNHPGCGRRFTKKGNLAVHVRTVHANEKNYTCGQYDLTGSTRVPGWSGVGCGVSFGTRQGLEGHIRTQHLGLQSTTKSSKTRKPTADRATSRALDSKVLGTLTGYTYAERPVGCLENLCESRFLNEHELATHLELHHGWNVDDINDCITEIAALQGDRFWIGGDDLQDEMNDQYTTSQHGMTYEMDIDPVAPASSNVQVLDPAFA